MRLFLVAAAMLVLFAVAQGGAQGAMDESLGPCDTSSSFTDATSTCWEEKDVQQAANTADNLELDAFCNNSGASECVKACEADGQPGTRYWVVVDDKIVSQTCLVTLEPDEPEVTPDRVLRAFQRLDWPKSELIVQPPDGKTLVNFDTNFLTENTETTRQQVTLLGQQITIEAWPESYTWEFGDGESVTTKTAGSPYPDLEVTHRYLSKETYAPSVATTYAGRFRVGGGPWVDIPGTHTVEGESSSLEVVGARPVLVAPDGG